MKKLLEKIGEFFSSLFNGANRTWKKVSPEVRNALLQGSGIVAIINKNIDQLPDFVLDLILKQYPDLPVEKIKEVLLEVGKVTNIEISDDILVTIQNVQKYLSERTGKVWAIASDTLAKVIAVFLAPKDTKVASIISLIVFVYHRFIKKEVEEPATV